LAEPDRGEQQNTNWRGRWNSLFLLAWIAVWICNCCRARCCRRAAWRLGS